MATREVTEEPGEPLKCKKWVLKVSVHCEGCKKKVKKLLHQVEGVYTVDVDIKQQRAIVTGDVEGDALIRKLIKSGKQAQLCVEKSDQKEKTSAVKGKSKQKETQQAENVNQETSQTGNAAAPGGEKEAEPPSEAAVTQDPPAKTDGRSDDKPKSGKDDATKVSSVETKPNSGEQPVKEAKEEGKKPETGPTGTPPPQAAEKKGGDIGNGEGGEKINGGNDDGSSGKKKKKKGQNGNNTDERSSFNVTPANTGSENHSSAPASISFPTNHGLPPQQYYYQYPPTHYYGPPPQAHAIAVRYNTAYPSIHTTSYYASPPPTSYAYAYPGQGRERELPPPPSDFDSYPRQPLDSFEMFSDENPNGCSIM